MSIVLKLENIKKHYKLYPSHIHMALDVSGYYKARFWKPYPAFAVKKALNDVSLEVKRGDRLGVLGRNGAGKTTMLKLAAGMISPSSGKIITQGSVQTLMHIGAAFHSDFSGAENIRHGLLYNGLRGRELDRAFDNVVEFVELGDFINQPVRSYSLGMTTRLQFAVATAVQPEILIIDEVLGAGDAYFATKSADRMRALTRSGCTLLLVSHSRSQIMEFCTSALWLDQGMVRQQGEVDEVLAAYDREIVAAIETNSQPQKGGERLLPTPSYMSGLGALSAALDTLSLLAGDLVWKPSALNNSQFEAAGTGAVKIERLILGSSGCEVNYYSTGDDFFCNILLSLNDSMRGKTVSCRLMIFAADGRYAADINSGSLLCKDNRQLVSLHMDRMPLGHREYVLAVLVESEGRVLCAQMGLYMKVNESNESDPPYALLNGTWSFSGGNKERSRICGTV